MSNRTCSICWSDITKEGCCTHCAMLIPLHKTADQEAFEFAAFKSIATASQPQERLQVPEIDHSQPHFRFRDLPLELLLHIFSFICCFPYHNTFGQGYNKLEQPTLLLAAVCVSWRRAIFSGPHMWLSVALDIRFHSLSTVFNFFLEKAANVEFESVKLFGELHPDASRRKAAWYQTNPALLYSLQRSRRVCVATNVFPYSTRETFVQGLFKNPRLIHLMDTIEAPFPVPLHIPFTTRTMTPALRSLSILVLVACQLDMSGESAELPSLTELWVGCNMGFRCIKGLLIASPNLKKLVQFKSRGLRVRLGSWRDDEEGDKRMITNLNLEHLQLLFIEGTSRSILRCLRVPNLKTLMLGDALGFPNSSSFKASYRALNELFANSESCLRLVHVGFDTIAISVQLLEKIPSVERLTLCQRGEKSLLVKAMLLRLQRLEVHSMLTYLELRVNSNIVDHDELFKAIEVRRNFMAKKGRQFQVDIWEVSRVVDEALLDGLSRMVEAGVVVRYKRGRADIY